MIEKNKINNKQQLTKKCFNNKTKRLEEVLYK